VSKAYSDRRRVSAHLQQGDKVRAARREQIGPDALDASGIQDAPNAMDSPEVPDAANAAAKPAQRRQDARVGHVQQTLLCVERRTRRGTRALDAQGARPTGVPD
jgi:hypothetical protein